MSLRLSTSSRRAAGQLQRSWRRSISTSTPDDWDVVIVGGGPAGLALASALGANLSQRELLNCLIQILGSSQLVRESLRVALVEASDLSKVRDWTQAAGTFSNRASSLTSKSQAFLKGFHLSFGIPTYHIPYRYSCLGPYRRGTDVSNPGHAGTDDFSQQCTCVKRPLGLGWSFRCTYRVFGVVAGSWIT